MGIYVNFTEMLKAEYTFFEKKIVNSWFIWIKFIFMYESETKIKKITNRRWKMCET